MARREIVVGQKYQKTDSTFIWEVTGLTKDAEGVVHARLTRIGDATVVKMISASALRDNRLYKLIQGA